MKTLRHVRLTPGKNMVDGKLISTSTLSGLYREICGDYPKFFKMDNLSRLGFLGAELALKELREADKENIAIILFNKNGSLITDRNYQQTIGDEDYFPSPAIFVYTLANIVTGEIAIRHKIYGETSFYILSRPDKKFMEEIVNNVFLTSNPDHILSGWVDWNSEEDFLADLKLTTKN